MRPHTRVYKQQDLAAALAQEEPELPLRGLVDLRHNVPLDRTQVLDDQTLQRLRQDYEALRGPLQSERCESEPTDCTTLPLEPRRFRLIGALVASLVALGSWSVCRTWITGQHVALASSQPAALPTVGTPVLAAALREPPAHPAPAHLPRVAVDALATGDGESARRAYDELARHEREPGPFSVAAEILARELRAGE